MKLLWLVVVGLVCLVVAGCRNEMVHPPVAKVVPVELTAHGDTRVDPYYWLRDREDPEVVSYLEEENAYTAAVMADTDELQRSLFAEIKGRIKQNDRSVPAPYRGRLYYKRFEDGKEYPIHCRREDSVDAPEQVILDVNEVAAGHEFCSVGGLQVSPDGKLLAYAADTVGRRKYTIRIRDLETGRDLDDSIENVTSNAVWANDSRTLFYTKQDPDTLRWNRVLSHRVGDPTEDDSLIWEETDPTFRLSLRKTRSDRFILIESEQTLSSEVRYIDADDPEAPVRVVEPRQRGVEYHVAHQGDDFLIRTNLDAPNFRLMRAPVDSPSRENWRDVVPHREAVFVAGVDAFREHLVLTERRDGLRRLRILGVDGGDGFEIEIDHPAPVVWVDENRVYDTALLRYGFESLDTPKSIYDFDTRTREHILLKQTEVLGGFDGEAYLVERLEAPARDGVMVPMSVVRHRGTELDGSNPLLLYAYGSYGSSTDPWFKPDVISLLDRGFVYAIAHIRGGQEMGRWWYEDGKLLNKKNTFTDFVDCGRFLVSSGYTSSGRIFAKGGSAGGLLMGAVVNMAPELFGGVIAEVPWVDVVTTMLDHSIPLTTEEFDEWGNPEDPEFYGYMLSYSPYDNVEAKTYPPMLVTTGLHDSQVQFWEPAKWVAKLRATKTDANMLILKTDMDSGHGGPSGRYDRYEETAFVYAFILKALGT